MGRSECRFRLLVLDEFLLERGIDLRDLHGAFVHPLLQLAMGSLQRLLGLLPLCNIDDRRQYMKALGQGDGVQADFDGEFGAVLALAG